MARASVFSMTIYSRSLSLIILLHTKSITIPVCRLRLVATCSNSALQLIKLIYVEEHSTAPIMARLRTAPKSYGSVNSERDHSSFSHQAFVGFQGGAFVISGLPGDGAVVAVFLTMANFTFLLFKINCCLFY